MPGPKPSLACPLVIALGHKTYSAICFPQMRDGVHREVVHFVLSHTAGMEAELSQGTETNSFVVTATESRVKALSKWWKQVGAEGRHILGPQRAAAGVCSTPFLRWDIFLFFIFFPAF